MENDQQLFDLPSAARALGGISVWTLRKHILRDTVQVTRLGRRVFLTRAELERIRVRLRAVAASAGDLVRLAGLETLDFLSLASVTALAPVDCPGASECGVCST